MLRTILITILFSISAFLCKANIESDNILGIWLMANKNVKVEMYKVDDLYFGKVIWMDEDADYEFSILLALGVAELTYNHFRKINRRLNMMRYMTLKNLQR